MKKFRVVNEDNTIYKNNSFKNYILAIYKYMTCALFLTLIVVIGSINSGYFMFLINHTKTNLFLMMSPIFIFYYIDRNMMSMPLSSARNAFMIFATFMGFSITSVFVLFTNISIIKTLITTCFTFLIMIIYGSNTKKDLSSLYSFFILGLTFLIISNIVNILLKSSIIYFFTSFLTTLFFTFLIAYDSQKVKNFYYNYVNNYKIQSQLSLYGALYFYMNFINLFISLLHLIGVKRND